MTFGEKLQALRRQRGLSQETLAEQLEVSRQAVSKWERDEAMPETEKVVHIARLFGISLDELLLDRPAAPPPVKPYTRPSFSEQFHQFLHRYGKRTGLALTIIGLVICLLSLGACLLYPTLAGSFMRMPLTTFGQFTEEFSWEFPMPPLPDGEEELPDYVWDAIADAQGQIPAAGGSFGGMIDSATEQMDSLLTGALRMQSILFLIGLLPGLLLMGCGIFITVKTKRLYATK